MSDPGGWPPAPADDEPADDETTDDAPTDDAPREPWAPHEPAADATEPEHAPAAPSPWPSPPSLPAPTPPAEGTPEPGGFTTTGDRFPVHPPVPHVPHPPHSLPRPTARHSRNPVDRLTRGLPSPVRVVVDWAVTILGAVAIVLLVKAFVINPYRIPSSSMETTLHCAEPASGCEARYSDRVLANRFLYHLRDPRRGEIAVFETPPAAQVKCGAGGTFVKRIVGLPGERIEVRLERGDGYVFVNGRKLAEPYIEKDRRGAVESFGPVKIPANSYFMMGDNRSQSCDSRVWGSVPRANLIGKVFATYWPPNRLGLH